MGPPPALLGLERPSCYSDTGTRVSPEVAPAPLTPLMSDYPPPEETLPPSRRRRKSAGATSALRCSFCHLGEGEVARLFEGYAGYICDECVDVCVQLLADYEQMGVPPRKLERPWYKRLFGAGGEGSGSCSFNLHDRHNPQGERLFPGDDARICDKCLRACEVLKSTLVLGG